ncbi:MAG: DUF1345 domain-containing protein [Burkholderiaceae bacterium]
MAAKPRVPPNASRLQKLGHWLRRPRLIIAGLLAVVTFLSLLPLVQISQALLLAFDAGAVLFLGLLAHLMAEATPQTMRHHAQIQEESKWAVLLLSLCITGVVIGALTTELHAAKVKSWADIALASGSIFLSWLFVAVMFAEHYAHSWYMTAGQMDFPGTEEPDYWDFIYFSLVISMCAQTSDVVIKSSAVRRLVALHSLVAFFFNVIIIAITVNVVAGVL